jgi:hypothetical protein
MSKKISINKIPIARDFLRQNDSLYEMWNNTNN